MKLQADKVDLGRQPIYQELHLFPDTTPRHLAAQSAKLKPLSQASHIVIRRRLPRKRAGQSNMAQLTASISAAPVWCACLLRVDVAKKKAAVRRPVESVTL